MEGTIKGTYKIDHTQLSEQSKPWPEFYSWLLSSGGKEVKGESLVWEVLTSKEKVNEPSNAGGAVDCIHTYIERARGRRERKSDKYEAMLKTRCPCPCQGRWN